MVATSPAACPSGLRRGERRRRRSRVGAGCLRANRGRPRDNGAENHTDGETTQNLIGTACHCSEENEGGRRRSRSNRLAVCRRLPRNGNCTVLPAMAANVLFAVDGVVYRRGTGAGPDQRLRKSGAITLGGPFGGSPPAGVTPGLKGNGSLLCHNTFSQPDRRTQCSPDECLPGQIVHVRPAGTAGSTKRHCTTSHVWKS